MQELANYLIIYLILFWEAVIGLGPILLIFAMLISYPVQLVIDEWEIYKFKKIGLL